LAEAAQALSDGYTDTQYFSGLLIGEEKNRWFNFTFEGGGTVTVTLIADRPLRSPNVTKITIQTALRLAASKRVSAA